MDFEIKIVKDNFVFELLDDKTFITQWYELAKQNEQVTVIQEPPFVSTWYRQYYKKYQPILILGFDNNSELVGLMPLAFSLKGQFLTHAGDYHAEYHGWLCKKDVDKDFPVQALIAVKNNFILRKWQWRPLPPRSQLNWISSSELKKENIYVSYAEEDSPVLDLKDENKINKLKTKSLTNQINRYKKRNGFYIERIRSKEKAIEIFDILADQCDFRQMAAHRSTPFASDGNKKQFYIERLNFPENNHFTITWSDNKPIAYHFGACDSDTVISGLASYDPLEEKNSPSKIHTLKLIELLREEGYHYFDLTPGGDNYKEEYATFHQKIYTLTVYFLKKDKIISDIKSSLKKIAKKWIDSAGVKPKIVRNKLDNALTVLKKILKLTPLKITRSFFSIIYEKKVYVIYRFLIDEESLNNFQIDENIHINNYSDLLLYNSANQNLDKKSNLFSRALRHFKSEDLLYTLVLKGVLAQYGWIAKGGKSHKLPEVDIDFDTPEQSVILYDFFTDPSFNKQELYTKTLERMLLECRNNGIKEVFLWVSENDSSERSNIEKVGFKTYRNIKRTNTLWLVHKKEYS